MCCRNLQTITDTVDVYICFEYSTMHVYVYFVSKFVRFFVMRSSSAIIRSVWCGRPCPHVGAVGLVVVREVE